MTGQYNDPSTELNGQEGTYQVDNSDMCGGARHLEALKVSN